jgi:hypothetical protein
MDNKIIEIKLQLHDLNNIIDALGQMPFFRVKDLIENIRGQALSQIEAPAETPAEE